jgi:hypothetical protein
MAGGWFCDCCFTEAYNEQLLCPKCGRPLAARFRVAPHETHLPETVDQCA